MQCFYVLLCVELSATAALQGSRGEEKPGLGDGSQESG